MKSSLIRAMAAAALALALGACTTTVRTETQRFYVPAKVVNVGDDVRVRTKDGRKMDFRVTAVDQTKIEGKGVLVKREELASVKTIQEKTVRVEETSGEPLAKTVTTIVTGYFVLIGVIVLAVLIAA